MTRRAVSSGVLHSQLRFNELRHGGGPTYTDTNVSFKAKQPTKFVVPLLKESLEYNREYNLFKNFFRATEVLEMLLNHAIFIFLFTKEK